MFSVCSHFSDATVLNSRASRAKLADRLDQLFDGEPGRFEDFESFIIDRPKESLRVAGARPRSTPSRRRSRPKTPSADHLPLHGKNETRPAHVRRRQSWWRAYLSCPPSG